MTTPYTAGTVTLTNGSAVITGIGTARQTALIAGGILIAEADGPLPILSIDSNTQITAAIKWKGVTGTYPYAIMRDTAYGQQTVANAQALANYLTRLDTATLSALNALGPSMLADRVPYATSNAAMAWAPFTAYGRTLVAATSDQTFAAAARVVRRSGGVNMGAGNDIMIGWHSTDGQLIAQVDAVSLGKVWTDYYATTAGAADIRSKIGAFSTSGGNITGSVAIYGNVDVVNNAVVSSKYFAATTPQNEDAFYFLRTGVSNRWGIYKSQDGGEAGNNLGSNFSISRYTDAGGFLGTSLQINRRYGVVETRETPACMCVPGAGNITLQTGQQWGLLGDGNGFDFNRGNSGGAFVIGGNPGAGGRAVHVPLLGWYKVTVTAVVKSAGAALGLAVNGNQWRIMYCGSSNWTSVSATFISVIAANTYISFICAAGPIDFSLNNSCVTVEFLQF